MRATGWAAVTAILALAGATPANAQFAAELRLGASAGNHRPAAAGLELSPGLAGSLMLLASPISAVDLYVTLGRSSFGCERGFCSGLDVSIANTAFGAGVRVSPIQLLWLQAGVAQAATSVTTAGTVSEGSGRLAVDGGGGLRFRATPRISMLPGLHFRTDLEEDGRTSVISLELGVNFAG